MLLTHASKLLSLRWLFAVQSYVMFKRRATLIIFAMPKAQLSRTLISRLLYDKQGIKLVALQPCVVNNGNANPHRTHCSWGCKDLSGDKA
jgi:hypothetical protein